MSKSGLVLDEAPELLDQVIAAKAKERQAEARKREGRNGGADSAPPTPDTGKTRTQVAKAVGMSHQTLTPALHDARTTRPTTR